MSNVTALSTKTTGFSLTPQTLEEGMKFAEMMAKSDIVPKDYKNNPGNVLVAIQWGMELGLQPMQAMQNIAVINGRPAIWGDAMLALVRSSPAFEYIKESVDGDVATCTLKRRGEPEIVRKFSAADAKAAGLLGKAGPWTQYRDRMMQMRARAFALRDGFADVLRGMQIAEEVQDIPAERDITPPRQKPAEVAAAAVPTATTDDPEERSRLISELTEVAEQGGMPALENHWKSVLNKNQRALVGPAALASIKQAIQPVEQEQGDAP